MPSTYPTVGTPIPSWQVATAAGCTTYEGYPYCSQSYRNGPDVAAEANWDFYVCADQNGCTDELLWRHQLCGTDVGRLSGAGQPARQLRTANRRSDSSTRRSTTLVWAPTTTMIFTTSRSSISRAVPFGFLSDPPAAGYDLATGWGSPNQSNLIEALLGQQGGLSFGLVASPTTLTIKQGSSASRSVSGDSVR